MIRIFIVLLITIVLLALEIFLSYRKNKWHGLVIPAVLFAALSIFLVFNVVDAFPSIEGFGGFLQSYGTIGVWALILKIGFAYTPVIINLVIYFVCQAIYKSKNPEGNNKELKKMMANDL